MRKICSWSTKAGAKPHQVFGTASRRSRTRPWENRSAETFVCFLQMNFARRREALSGVSDRTGEEGASRSGRSYPGSCRGEAPSGAGQSGLRFTRVVEGRASILRAKRFGFRMRDGGWLVREDRRGWRGQVGAKPPFPVDDKVKIQRWSEH